MAPPVNEPHAREAAAESEPARSVRRPRRPSERRRRALPALGAGVALILAVAACSPGGTDAQPTEGSAPATGDASSPAPSASAEPSSTASETSGTDRDAAGSGDAAAPDDGDFGVAPQESDGFPEPLAAPSEGEDLLLEDVRVGVHEGFDRIVFDHTDGAQPGYRVEYVEEPTEPGSGQPLEMAGSAYLAVHVTGLRPGMAGEEHGHAVLDTSWTGESDILQETVTTSVFEGAASYYVSLDEERPFSVQMLEDGSRLVIDVEN